MVLIRISRYLKFVNSAKYTINKPNQKKLKCSALNIVHWDLSMGLVRNINCTRMLLLHKTLEFSEVRCEKYTRRKGEKFLLDLRLTCLDVQLWHRLKDNFLEKDFLFLLEKMNMISYNTVCKKHLCFSEQFIKRI